MSKIPETAIPDAYSISVSVYNSETTMSEGAKLLSQRHGLKMSSARDYIYDFRYLMQGKRFTRKLNQFSMEYFFSQILKDYGVPGITSALTALGRHIQYLEQMGDSTRTMKQIFDKYSAYLISPVLITSLEQLTRNIDTIETYLTEGEDQERLYASLLIKRGTCFIAYKIDKELRFAPSRFLGYENNKMNKYSTGLVDGRLTNKAIKSILKVYAAPNADLERKYFSYCKKLGIAPSLKGGAYGIGRKFWELNLDHDFHNNNDLSGEFPEGKIVERTHKARERNPKVIEIAKLNFKRRHGKLFCQVCGFDFEKIYGDIGKDLIEGHHTIAVTDMPPDYKTKPEEIAILCANCHRIVHRKRPWLSMDKLTMLLK